MEWSDSALVLSMGRFREADLWVRMLTRRHGIVSAFAFGGSRSRRRFAGCLDLLNELQISTKSTGNGMYLALQETILLNGPRRLRTDWKRLGMMMNCVRFLEALGVPPDGALSAYTLLRDSQRMLETTEYMSDLFPLFFRLRLAAEQGYAPSLSVCAHCGEPATQAGNFFVSDGVFLCASCLSQGSRGGYVSISAPALAVLRQVQETSPLVWAFVASPSAGEQGLPSAVRRECARAIDGFVQYHLGLMWDKGRFRRG